MTKAQRQVILISHIYYINVSFRRQSVFDKVLNLTIYHTTDIVSLLMFSTIESIGLLLAVGR